MGICFIKMAVQNIKSIKSEIPGLQNTALECIQIVLIIISMIYGIFCSCLYLVEQEQDTQINI